MSGALASTTGGGETITQRPCTQRRTHTASAVAAPLALAAQASVQSQIEGEYDSHTTLHERGMKSSSNKRKA